ncbi:MAG: hypothetical protein OEM26_18775 [Saprospiraceae bacterium]|nr:hypothetical protein [Saprospiraceae bacterium]
MTEENLEFEQIESLVRSHIAKNEITQAIEVLSASLDDDEALDDIALQSANYHAAIERQLQGTADPQEIDRILNQLRLNILRLIRSKKDYIKYRKQTFGSRSASSSDPSLIKVFFSVGSPHNDKQQKYVDGLTEYFRTHGIQLNTLREWNDNDPLDPILRELRQASGCLVLALERYFISSGKLKRGSEQEADIIERSYTSPWLHIESALARSLNLPLIILKEESLANDGLIHNDKQEWGIVRVHHERNEEIGEYPIKNFILNWINQVKSFHHRNRS